jgi:hypothetical protein
VYFCVHVPVRHYRAVQQCVRSCLRTLALEGLLHNMQCAVGG